MNPLRTGARILADQLRIQGVNHIFCRTATEWADILEPLGETGGTGGIRTIAVQHTAVAAGMANTYARITGQTGVAFACAGTPAGVFPTADAPIFQSVGALRHARQNGLPLALIVVRMSDGPIQDGIWNETRDSGWAPGLRQALGVKWAGTANDADRLPDLVSLAFQTASSGHPGPVILILSAAALTQTSAIGNGICRPPILPAPSDMQIASLRRLLGQAQRPVAVIGGMGGNRSTLDNLRAFVDANRLPIACVPGAQDEFDNRHSHYIGDAAVPSCRARILNADLVLALGIAWPPSGIVHGGIDPASDDATDRQVLVHAHPAVERLYEGRADLTLHTGMPQLAARLAMMTPIENPPWANAPAEGHAALQAWQSRPAIPEFADSSALAPWRVLQDLRATLPDDAVVCSGSGAASAWLNRFFSYRAPATQLTSPEEDPGSAVASAVAAKIVAPDKIVVCVCRDDDLIAGASTLATAMACAVGVVILVLRDQFDQWDRSDQWGQSGPERDAPRQQSPDLVAMMDAAGGWGMRIAAGDDFPAAFAGALAHARVHRRPALVEISASFHTR